MISANMHNIRAAIGASVNKDIHSAVQEVSRACQNKFPIGHTDLAIVFTTIGYAHEITLASLRRALKPATALIGCSATALITPKGIMREGIAAMLISCPALHLSTYCVRNLKSGDANACGQELGTNIVLPVKGRHRELLLMFNDGLIEDADNFTKGILSAIGSGLPVIGAGSADDFNFKQTFQYYNDEVLRHGAAACLFAGKSNYAIDIQHGLNPLGKTHIVTSAYSNIILEIDRKNAACLYEDYFGKPVKDLQKDIPYINTLYPIGICGPGNKYVIRNVLCLNENGSIVTQGPVAEGSPVRLMIGTKESCLQAASGAAQTARLNFGSQKPDFVLVLNSSSRAKLFGRFADEEIRIIRDTFGQEVPLLGFYGYGQLIASNPLQYAGQPYYHNQSIAVLAFGGR